MTEARWIPLRTAWQAALYGPEGFYRRERPGDHFRTSPHASSGFADAVVELAHRHGLTRVWDIGAGDGDLLHHISASAPDLDLVGVDIRGRPASLPAAVGWQQDFPAAYDGLVLANELLDNVPCDVVELDPDGRVRGVEVNRETGAERLGADAPADQREWVEGWWPLTRTGQRAEVGLAREALWATIHGATRGLCAAVDFGHLAGQRPPGGSLSSYRRGVQTPVDFGGDHDVTAGLAFDALASVVGGEPRRQRAVLQDLGVDGRRPPLDRATEDPAGYLRGLVRAGEAAELVEVGGLGDFYWLLSPGGRGGPWL